MVEMHWECDQLKRSTRRLSVETGETEEIQDYFGNNTLKLNFKMIILIMIQIKIHKYSKFFQTASGI